MKKNIYIEMREAFQEEKRHMAIPQTGSAVIVTDLQNRILLLRKVFNHNLWVIPGGVQELGEDLRLTASRELKEETGITCKKEDLIFVDIVTGEGRHKIYPNGDEVYNNTVLFCLPFRIKNSDEINIEGEDYTDIGGSNYQITRESSEYKWFQESEIPQDISDLDLIEKFFEFSKNHKF